MWVKRDLLAQMQIDLDFLRYGLCFYQDLSEDETQKLCYAYGVGDIEATNDFLSQFDIDLQVVKKGKWAVIEGDDAFFAFDAFEQISLSKAFSFLFGSAILRWDWDVRGGKLAHLKIFFPVFEASKKELLKKVLTFLGKQQVVIEQNIVAKGRWEIWQWDIDDLELLNVFSSWTNLPSLETQIQQQQTLLQDFILPDEVKGVKLVRY